MRLLKQLLLVYICCLVIAAIIISVYIAQQRSCVKFLLKDLDFYSSGYKSNTCSGE